MQAGASRLHHTARRGDMPVGRRAGGALAACAAGWGLLRSRAAAARRWGLHREEGGEAEDAAVADAEAANVPSDGSSMHSTPGSNLTGKKIQKVLAT